MHALRVLQVPFVLRSAQHLPSPSVPLFTGHTHTSILSLSARFNILYWFISDYADREAEEEIEEIRAKVPIKDRPYFFK